MSKVTGRKQFDNKHSIFSDTAKKALIILVCIVAFLGIMYFVTNRILAKANTTKKEVEEAVIQYDKILAGESFNQKEDEYLVVYYDSSDKYSTLSSIVSSYQSQSDVTRLYSVDLNDGMNKKYISDSVVTDSISDLKVVYPTLLRFKNHKVVEVITSSSEINSYLSK